MGVEITTCSSQVKQMIIFLTPNLPNVSIQVLITCFEVVLNFECVHRSQNTEISPKYIIDILTLFNSTINAKRPICVVS